MSDLEHSILASLDGQDPRLFPFLPQLLQDLDDLGTEPATIAGLLEAHASLPLDARVLDLGCGKGSVALHLLQRHPWRALGLDGMPAFVARAQARAEALGLADRCHFELADIRTWRGEGRFDIIVLGAIGPVLGDTATTLRHVAPWLAPGGVVVVDEVYLPDAIPSRNAAYNKTKAELLDAIDRANFSIVAESRGERDSRADAYTAMFEAIRVRAEALSLQYPEHRSLFDAYVAKQAEEFEILEEEVVDVTLLCTLQQGRHRGRRSRT